MRAKPKTTAQHVVEEINDMGKITSEMRLCKVIARSTHLTESSAWGIDKEEKVIARSTHLTEIKCMGY